MSELIKPFPAPPGWVGGFEQSNPAFAYPSRNLNSLPIYHNMENIDKLTRQQKVVWPQFSWLTEKDENGWIKDSRCYQRFAPDISRLGYDDSGRVYSIICPQQGASSPRWGKNSCIENPNFCKIHPTKISFFTKFKIHIFEFSIFTKFTFLKSHFSQNSHF